MAIRHIVLFGVRGKATSEQVDSALAALRSLAASPGLLEYRVERSLDGRKGLVIVENALFADADALDLFRRSHDHGAAADVLKEIADWLIGDYEE